MLAVLPRLDVVKQQSCAGCCLTHLLG